MRNLTDKSCFSFKSISSFLILNILRVGLLLDIGARLVNGFDAINFVLIGLDLFVGVAEFLVGGAGLDLRDLYPVAHFGRWSRNHIINAFNLTHQLSVFRLQFLDELVPGD